MKEGESRNPYQTTHTQTIMHNATRKPKARKPKAPKPQGVILHRGPSAIDGRPILVIATCLQRPSTNRKTGPMVQVVIIPLDESPLAALASGADASVCGNCPHRPKFVEVLVGKRKPKLVRRRVRTCYVDVGKSIEGIYRGYVRGIYLDLTAEPDPLAAALALAAPRQLRAGVRLGAYGDPAAAPYALWRCLAPFGVMAHIPHTGYTHQWRQPWIHAGFRQLVQASCDTEQDFSDAKASGWWTFSVHDAATDPAKVLRTANGPKVLCPAVFGDATCARCHACNGLRIDVYLPAHGASKASVAAW